VWLWSLPSGKLLAKLLSLPSQVETVEFSPDGSLLFAGARDGTLRAYSMASREAVMEAYTPVGVLSLALSPDGRLLVTGGHDGQIISWTVRP
jgi:WD40 repeat protein